MVLDTLLAPAPAAGASDAISAAVVRMVEGVGPSVVQVQRHGHGGGAGVIWQSNGGILTNYHVVGHGGDGITVLLTDGRRLKAEVTSGNRALDLAMLKVAADDLPAAPVGDSTGLRIGELVFAVGHPWGQRGAVTAGIVSGLGSVPIPGSKRAAQFIRSDVRLAPGNSGGPLLNAGGAVIGINAMIFGGDMGVAIPSHVATTWVAGLPSRRAYLGVGVQPVEVQAPRQGPWNARAAGLQIVSVQPDGPAARAGVLVGDVLLSVEGEPVEEPNVLLDTLAESVAKETVQLHLLRRGALLALGVHLESEAPTG